MRNLASLKPTFDGLVKEGCLGITNGKPAYAYIRVSSEEQAQEGSSGLPRQLEHLHEVALRNGYSITWERLFADDDSGFDFVSRPGLNRLRNEYKSGYRSAETVVIEHLDRLSRNADWHQGFLLDEMKQNGLSVLFWKSFGSRVERAVMGAISQDGMEQSKERMLYGNIKKAESGRVTARTRAFGYKFVDQDGQETPSSRKYTYYAVLEEEAAVIRYIFEQVALHHIPLRSLAAHLNLKYPKRDGKIWDATQVRHFLKQPIYKGQFISRREARSRVPQYDKNGTFVKMVEQRTERPPEEWIIVSVPAIVSEEIWEMANEALEKNRQTASRNGKGKYLLTGLLTCATCGFSYSASANDRTKRLVSGDVKRYDLSNYRCSSRNSRMPQERERIGCNQASISTGRLEEAVWSAVTQVLLEPALVIEALERLFYGDGNKQLQEQISYLEAQITAKGKEDEKLYRAFMADVFDEQEYKRYREQLKEDKVTLEMERSELSKRLMTPEQFEKRKQMVLQACEKVGELHDVPFERKREIIKLLVDGIIVDANAQQFTIEGSFNNSYQITANGVIVVSPVDRDSSPSPAGNSPGTSATLWRG
jgi:site-specific DNA recombinase